MTTGYSQIGLADVAKAVTDLGTLIRSLGAALPAMKPWPRQVRRMLNEADRHLRVRRMTISFERPESEVSHGARDLVDALRDSNAWSADVRMSQVWPP